MFSKPVKNNIHLIHHFLENSARTYPYKVAVIHGSESYTFKEVEEMSNKVANYLLNCGIKSGDRCAILLRNSIGYIISYYGALKTGAITVPINTGIDEKEINAMLFDCSPKILITENFFSQKLEGIVHNNPPFSFLLLADDGEHISIGDKSKTFNLYQLLKDYSSQSPPKRIIASAPASIIYTSGSTGSPKGAVLTHFNIVSNTRSIVSYLKLNKNDRIMVVLPFYYVYGKSLLNTHFFVGGSVVIDNRFIFPNLVLKGMVEENVTGFSGVPSTFSILINKSNIRKLNFPHLRYLTQAGGHMPRRIKEELLRIFPDKDIFIMYGATEASARLSYLEPYKLREKIDSIGKAIPEVELKLVKENGKEAEIGEEGEIIARGSNIMLGYWNNPEETKKVLREGWYYTGDLAIQDEEGYLYITGRKKDIVKVGIHKISAKEVEDVLYEHEEIYEAAVIGIQDEVLGEALRAYVVSKNNASIMEEDIINFCESKLPEYKVPKQIFFVDSIPKNESGKVLKQKLLNYSER